MDKKTQHILMCLGVAAFLLWGHFSLQREEAERKKTLDQLDEDRKQTTLQNALPVGTRLVARPPEGCIFRGPSIRNQVYTVTGVDLRTEYNAWGNVSHYTAVMHIKGSAGWTFTIMKDVASYKITEYVPYKPFEHTYKYKPYIPPVIYFKVFGDASH